MNEINNTIEVNNTAEEIREELDQEAFNNYESNEEAIPASEEPTSAEEPTEKKGISKLALGVAGAGVGAGGILATLVAKHVKEHSTDPDDQAVLEAEANLKKAKETRKKNRKEKRTHLEFHSPITIKRVPKTEKVKAEPTVQETPKQEETPEQKGGESPKASE